MQHRDAVMHPQVCGLSTCLLRPDHSWACPSTHTHTRTHTHTNRGRCPWYWACVLLPLTVRPHHNLSTAAIYRSFIIVHSSILIIFRLWNVMNNSTCLSQVSRAHVMVCLCLRSSRGKLGWHIIVDSVYQINDASNRSGVHGSPSICSWLHINETSVQGFLRNMLAFVTLNVRCWRWYDEWLTIKRNSDVMVAWGTGNKNIIYYNVRTHTHIRTEFN